jgi:positive phototaxis protein PixI
MMSLTNLSTSESGNSSSNLPLSSTETQFLRVHLVSETVVLLPCEKVTQVLTIAVDRVVSMPHMAPWIMGAYNYRGEILWLVDLGYLIGLKPISQQARSFSHYTTTVIQINSEDSIGRLLGMVVNRVNSTEQCKSGSIKASSAAPNTEFEELVKGYWEKSATETLAILDLDLIWQKIVEHPLANGES